MLIFLFFFRVIKQTSSDTELLYGLKITVYSSQLEKSSSSSFLFFLGTRWLRKSAQVPCYINVRHCGLAWHHGNVCVSGTWLVAHLPPLQYRRYERPWQAQTARGAGVVCLWRVVTTHQKLMCCCTAGCLRSVTVATVKSVDLQTQRLSFNLPVTLTRVLTLLIQINHIFYSVY